MVLDPKAFEELFPDMPKEEYPEIVKPSKTEKVYQMLSKDYAIKIPNVFLPS